MGGGRSGNTEGVEDNQSGSESNTERKGSVCVWDARELEGKMGASGALVDVGKSSSNVTHCWVGLPLPGGGGCRRGARAGGREEAGATGKAGAGDGSAVRENREAGVGLRADDGPNRDMLFWSWEAGAAPGAAAGAKVGLSGWV